MAKLLTGFDVISCFSELLRRVNPLLTVICLQCVDSFVGPWNLKPKCRSALSPSRSSITPYAIERAQKSCLENTRYKLSELPCICHQQRLNSREISLFCGVSTNNPVWTYFCNCTALSGKIFLKQSNKSLHSMRDIGQHSIFLRIIASPRQLYIYLKYIYISLVAEVSIILCQFWWIASHHYLRKNFLFRDSLSKRFLF